MLSKLNLVVLTLALNCLISALAIGDKFNEDLNVEPKKVSQIENVHLLIKRPSKPPFKVSINRPQLTNTNLSVMRPVDKYSTISGTKTSSPIVNNKLSTNLEGEKSAKSKKDHHRPRKHKKHMNRGLMALLLAYKLKFAALIPTMIMGLLLLLSTTALAGFFFALFAAILGLKGH